jgi:hypothetical protein
MVSRYFKNIPKITTTNVALCFPPKPPHPQKTKGKCKL